MAEEAASSAGEAKPAAVKSASPRKVKGKEGRLIDPWRRWTPERRAKFRATMRAKFADGKPKQPLSKKDKNELRRARYHAAKGQKVPPKSKGGRPPGTVREVMERKALIPDAMIHVRRAKDFLSGQSRDIEAALLNIQMAERALLGKET